MPIVPVYDLEWNPARNELVAATFGRSIQSYVLDDLIVYHKAIGYFGLSKGVSYKFDGEMCPWRIINIKVTIGAFEKGNLVIGLGKYMAYNCPQQNSYNIFFHIT